MYTREGGKTRTIKDEKDARNRKIYDLWMQCYTRDEIAEIVSVSTGEVSAITSKMATLPNLTKPSQSATDHATDFKPPIYNVWKQQTKSNKTGHFGNSEQTWPSNALHRAGIVAGWWKGVNSWHTGGTLTGK